MPVSVARLRRDEGAAYAEEAHRRALAAAATAAASAAAAELRRLAREEWEAKPKWRKAARRIRKRLARVRPAAQQSVAVDDRRSCRHGAPAHSVIRAGCGPTRLCDS